MTIKPAHKILRLTHRNCWGKPNIWMLPPLLQKNKLGRSQLYRDQLFSHTIYLYNRKFDWCLIVDLIWLVWHTYISHWSTHWTAHNIPDAPTKRYFFYKKITEKFRLNFSNRWTVTVLLCGGVVNEIGRNRNVLILPTPIPSSSWLRLRLRSSIFTWS